MIVLLYMTLLGVSLASWCILLYAKDDTNGSRMQRETSTLLFYDHSSGGGHA
jgi:hypothetical protein